MTDEEVWHKWMNLWDSIAYHYYEDWLKTIPTNILIQITRYGNYHSDIKELKSRAIPEELKLEVLLLLGK